MQSIETVNEAINQKQNSPALNGKDDSIEKVSKASTVLGKSQAKKRLMAFSMMKQKLQEQNNLITDNQSSDIGEGNDAEFVPEHNVFQTVTKKKVVTNKKGKKVPNYIIYCLFILLCIFFEPYKEQFLTYFYTNSVKNILHYFIIYIGLLRLFLH